MINKNTKITVLMGGPSDEAEISRKTGKAIVNALSGLGYSVVGLEYHPECVLKQLQELNTEIVFLALHGKYGEDGTIQGLLELAGIPYTGSGVSSSAITMDKIFTAHIFKEQGIRMAKSMSFKEKEGIDFVNNQILKNFNMPVVLKPACEGSTIGIEIVKESNDLKDAICRVFKVESRILVEEYLDGEEFTVPVMNGKAMPVIQICPHSGQYDFHSKYTKGATDYLVPAPISEELKSEMQLMAEKGYHVAECEGVVRFDMRTDRNGVPYVLEANSIPGMTETSLVPKSAANIGISFAKLCEMILEGAGLNKV